MTEKPKFKPNKYTEEKKCKQCPRSWIIPKNELPYQCPCGGWLRNLGVHKSREEDDEGVKLTQVLKAIA